MKKAVIYIAMSLDGFIADANGGVGWLGGDGSDAASLGSYPEFVQTVDTVILGYTTYHQIITELSPDAWPYEGMHTCVLTHRDCPDQKGITFTAMPLADLLAKLKQEPGKNIWICGGASIIHQALQSQAAEELIISIMPVLLGSGIRLFDRMESSQKLKLISSRSYNGITDLSYQVQKDTQS
jgi:dihydrofolate reductase